MEMHDLGVLGRFVPEFGRLTCKVQHDLYHCFTADVHVLRCIDILDQIFQGETARSGTLPRSLAQKRGSWTSLSYLICSRYWKRPWTQRTLRTWSGTGQNFNATAGNLRGNARPCALRGTEPLGDGSFCQQIRPRRSRSN